LANGYEHSGIFGINAPEPAAYFGIGLGYLIISLAILIASSRPSCGVAVIKESPGISCTGSDMVLI
jgi:hypothetical protein